MKRFLIAAALVAALPVAAQQGRRAWSQVAAPAPAGSYVIGNPKARVKLVEYVSYTCPHCRHFTEESAAVLKGRMIASGSTSVEIRSAVHDKLDLAAATLARCSGPTAFPALHDALFARQEEWTDRAIQFDRANGQRLAMYPQGAQLKALSDGAGLSEIARGAGMSAAAIDQCFTDPAMLARTLDVAKAVNGRISGTPAFELNGKLIEGVTWAKLEPMLRAAGAR